MAKDLYSGGASGVLYTDRRDFYIDPQVVKELWTDVAPFTTLISNKETRQVNDPLFKMFEHRNPWVKQSVTVDDAAGVVVPNDDYGIAVTVDGIANLAGTPDNSYLGLVFEAYDIGVMVCTAVSGNDLTMKALDSGFTLPDDTVLNVIGSAFGEGSYSPDAWADELEVVYNSAQIFKTPVEVTGTLLQAALRGESSELARLREQKNQEHKMQKEKAFLFGKRFGGTNLGGTDGALSDGGRSDADGRKIRTTYGIVSAIEEYGAGSGDNQSVFTISEATYKYEDFVDDMEKVFQYVPESGVKRAFCGAGALGYWSKMAGATGIAGLSGWTVNLGDMKRDSLGFNYKVLETPHGILQLIPTPALRGEYNKHMLVVDDANLFHAQYRSPMYQTNIKTDNGYDGVKDQYFSDEGVGVQLIESHNLFKIAD
jgi:hypothetical protein